MFISSKDELSDKEQIVWDETAKFGLPKKLKEMRAKAEEEEANAEDTERDTEEIEDVTAELQKQMDALYKK